MDNIALHSCFLIVNPHRLYFDSLRIINQITRNSGPAREDSELSACIRYSVSRGEARNVMCDSAVKIRAESWMRAGRSDEAKSIAVPYDDLVSLSDKRHGQVEKNRIAFDAVLGVEFMIKARVQADRLLTPHPRPANDRADAADPALELP